MPPKGVLRSWGGLALAVLLEIGGIWWIWYGAGEGRGLLWSAVGILLLATSFVLVASRGGQRFGAVLLANGGALVVGALIYASVFDGMGPGLWDGLGIALCALGIVVIVHGRRRTRCRVRVSARRLARRPRPARWERAGHGLGGRRRCVWSTTPSRSRRLTVISRVLPSICTCPKNW